jgi:hypothetical protein
VIRPLARCGPGPSVPADASTLFANAAVSGYSCRAPSSASRCREPLGSRVGGLRIGLIATSTWRLTTRTLAAAGSFPSSVTPC